MEKKKKFPEKEEKSCKGSKAGMDGGGGREERKMDGGDGSHTGSIGSQVISAPMQKGKSITGTLRQIRATDVISSSFIAR